MSQSNFNTGGSHKQSEPPKTGQESGSLSPNYTWMKIGIGLLEDPDFMSISDSSVGIYVKLYLLAGKADAGGLLCNGRRVFDVKELAWHLRADKQILEVALRELTEAGFVNSLDNGYAISRFLEEQGPGDNAKREQWRERQRRHRQKANGGSKELKADADLDLEPDVELDIEGDKISHGDITVTGENTHSLSASPPPPLFEQLEERGGMFVSLKEIEQLGLDKIYDRLMETGLQNTTGMIQFGFLYLNHLLTGEISGHFYLSPSETEKIEAFFSKFPIVEHTEDDETYQKIDFDMDLWGEAIDFYFWKWHATGRVKFNASELIELFRLGSSHIAAEVDSHPEYYRDCPAVKIVEDVTRQAVPIELFPDVYGIVGEQFNNPKQAREILADYWKTWRRRGYRKENWEWFFDWFANGKDVWDHQSAEMQSSEVD